MTRRERVLRAIQFQDTDIVPYDVGFTHIAYQKLADYYGDPNFGAKLGNHLACMNTRADMPWVEVGADLIRDEWGVVWNRTIDKDIGAVANQMLPSPTLKGFQFPELIPPGIEEHYRRFAENARDLFRMADLGFSLFERAWTMRGFDHLLMDMIEHPSFVHELLEAITEWNLAQIDLAVKQDIDCFRLGDDWGSQRGVIMGPALWREFIKPCVRKMYQRIHEGGKYVLIHSCGDVKDLLPDLVEVGLNIFNPFQPEVMDVFETKKRYYGKLSFYGGIGVQTLLPHGTPDEVRRETKMLLETLGKGGGYIASPSHSIPSDVPAENMAAMIETLRGQE